MFALGEWLDTLRFVLSHTKITRILIFQSTEPHLKFIRPPLTQESYMPPGITVRLIRMAKFWEKMLRLPKVRLLTSAYWKNLKNIRLGLWPNQFKEILGLCGLSKIWNEGKEPMEESVSAWKEVQRTIINQENPKTESP